MARELIGHLVLRARPGPIRHGGGLSAVRRACDTSGMGHRNQADRDALTVEIGFAVLTGGLLAGCAFLTVCAPSFLLSSRGVGSGLLVFAAAVAVVVFLGRVIDVLWRFGRRDTGREIGRGAPPVPGQPSHPGRTSPDS